MEQPTGLTQGEVVAPNLPKFPTETINLPSEGRFYDPQNPLIAGKIELYYPSARSEDILTSRNLITKGIVVDKFIESLIVDDRVNLNTILMGDKNAVIIASRMLAYGKDYEASVECPSCSEKNDVTIDLSLLSTKEISAGNYDEAERLFSFTLPSSKAVVKFKLLTQADNDSVEAEQKSVKKLTKTIVDMEITSRLRNAIVSIDGNTDRQLIKKFVDNMLAIDSSALRKEIRKVTPDVDMRFDFVCESCSHEERMTLPLGVSFFWPAGTNR